MLQENTHVNKKYINFIVTTKIFVPPAKQISNAKYKGCM
jgi:hypothetical protein